MSKDNVRQMFGKLEKDADLRKKYSELMRAYQMETESGLAAKLVEFGKTSGFSFSKDDLMAARAELVDKINSNGELSDLDLQKVAGGDARLKAFQSGMSIITLGLACAIASVHQESQYKDPGGCSRYFSTSGDC